MREQDGPAVADPVVEIDRALRRLGGEVRRFGIDSERHCRLPLCCPRMHIPVWRHLHIGTHRPIKICQRRALRGDALDYRPPRRYHLAVLIGEDLKSARHGLQQLAGTQQELGIARPPETFIAEREGLVNQEAAGRHGGNDRGQKRAVKVVGDHHAGEAARPQRPAARAFEVGAERRDLGSGGELAELPNVPVDRQHRMTMRRQQGGVPAGSAGEIEGLAAGQQQAEEPLDPGRWPRLLTGRSSSYFVRSSSRAWHSYAASACRCGFVTPS